MKIPFKEIKQGISIGLFDPARTRLELEDTILHVLAECKINGILKNNCYPAVLDFFKFLIDRTNIDINYQNELDQTPLHISCRLGDYEITKILLGDERIRPNIPDQYHDTPLQLAINYRNFDVTRLLIKNKKVDLKYQNEHSPFVLYGLCFVSYIPQNQILVENIKDGIDFDLVEFLVGNRKDDIDLNQRNTHGVTSLNLCLLNGKIDIARYLIYQGADYDHILQGDYKEIKSHKEDVEDLEKLIMELSNDHLKWIDMS